MPRPSGPPVRCVALLRGINVGKAKRIGMAELRSAVEEAGFTDVRTLLNSGNLIFSAPRRDPARIAADVEGAITGAFGITSRVLVLTATEVDRIVAENTLVDRMTNPSHLFVTILAEPLSASPAAVRAAVDGLVGVDWSPEVLAVGSRALYQWCPNGSAGSRLPDAVARAVRDGATTRNWGTLGKLQALLRDPPSAN